MFGIKHYAGEVFYTNTGFLDKNRDSVQEDVVEIFRNSKVRILLMKNENISKLFDKARLYKAFSSANQLQSTTALSVNVLNGTTSLNNMRKNTNSSVANDKLNVAQSSKARTAGSSFRSQLNSLIMTLGSTAPHYVRCVKPNWEKKPFFFDNTLVLAQLRYSGMLETIRIRKSGYPVRFPYQDFVGRFRFLVNSNLTNPREACTAYLKVHSKSDWKEGSTKIFLKQSLVFIILTSV
jgi:myosin-7